jgi:hypothetical protein
MLNHFTYAHGEKSGKHKFAFSWDLLGGAPTQGQTRTERDSLARSGKHRHATANTLIEPAIIVAPHRHRNNW